MIRIPIILIILLILTICIFFVLLLHYSYKLNTSKKREKILKTSNDNYITIIEKRLEELQQYQIAYFTLKSLFNSRPKSIVNGMIKKSFELKENGTTTNTIKVIQENKSIKRIRSIGKLYFEYNDSKDFIDFDTLNRACKSSKPLDFNIIYQNEVRHFSTSRNIK